MIIRRGELADVYVENGRSVVMVGESVLVLSEIATAILVALPTGVSLPLDQITEHIVDLFGVPEGRVSAEEIARHQVFDLGAHHVLVIDGVDAATPASVRDLERAAAKAAPPDGGAVTALRSALRLLCADAPGTWALPEGLTSPEFVAAAQQHHVVAYLGGRLHHLELPAQAQAEIEATASRHWAGAAILATDLARALTVLKAANVRALAFKGVALAAQAYGDFAARGAGDLDLLVPPVDLEAAYEALTRAGWSPAAGYPTAGSSWAWRHFMRTDNEVTLVGDNSSIDLHWHLVPTRGTFPDFGTLWERREIVSVAGSPTPTLSRYDALAHSAGDAAKDEWRWLRGLLDVHSLMRARRTWLGADRPLRPDQLLTLGLAVRAFGMPLSVPPVVDLTVRRMDDALVGRVHRRQMETSAKHQPLSIPGLNFVHRMQNITLTRGSLTEAARLLSRSALPPSSTAGISSRWAHVSIPKALANRIRELDAKFRSLR